MSAPARPVRLLVIEDNPADVLLVRESLRSGGVVYEMESYTDGPDALAAVSRASVPPDLVLLDLNLPRVEGLDVLKALRARPGFEKVPIYVFTSSRSPKDRELAIELGATGCVEKPTELDRFIEVVNEMIRKTRSDSTPAG